uniref:Putative dna-directed rna polymerase iii subunit rpc7-like protein n=1 Tax=Amblyomma sculptum TaxID=1581419 RepID=A0A1E1XV22_AMBSC
MSFNVEQLGLTRQEAALTLCQQPPPAFPPLDFSPAPLVNSGENTYLAVLLREQRKNLRESSFNVAPCKPPQIVERYSDRYQVPKAPDVVFDFSYFPSELKVAKKAKKTKKPAKASKGRDAIATGLDIQKKLQALEETEAGGESGEEGDEEPGEKKPKEGEEEEEEEGAEELDEEELEEETDYAFNHFDNGESYLTDEDDNLDDGAVY